jgi:hypothetical protein
MTLLPISLKFLIYEENFIFFFISLDMIKSQEMARYWRRVDTAQ